MGGANYSSAGYRGEMIRAVLICGDVVGGPGGAGQVTKNELMALKEVFG